MDLQQAAQVFKLMQTEMAAQLPNLIREMGMNVRAVVTSRITGQGMDSDGSAFPYPYSKAYQKLKSGKTKSRKGKKRGDYDVGHRNFIGVGAKRGSMINAFKVFKESGNRYVLGFQSEKEKAKAEGNSFGNGKWDGVGTNIIEPSQKEVDGQIRIMEKRLEKILKKHLT